MLDEWLGLLPLIFTVETREKYTPQSWTLPSNSPYKITPGDFANMETASNLDMFYRPNCNTLTWKLTSITDLPIYGCIYVCPYVYMCVCMYVFMYVCIVCWRMYVCVYMYVYVCIVCWRLYVWMHGSVCMYECMVLCACTSMHAYMNVCKNAWLFVYLCRYAWFCVCIYVCMHGCVCMYVCMCVYEYVWVGMLQCL